MTAATPYLLEAPRLGEGLFEVRIVALFKRPGDAIQEDEPLYELESDKATVSIESPHRGILLAWRVAEGDVIRVGAPVAEIQVASGTTAAAVPLPPTPPTEAPAAMPVVTPTVTPAAPAEFVPPRTRAHARSRGLAPEQLAAIPRAGKRLTPEDVDAFLKAPAAATPTAFSDHPLSPKQRTLVYRMRRSRDLVIPCTMVARVRIDGLEFHAAALLRQEGAEARQYFVSPFQIFAYAVAQAVKRAPLFRSQMLSDGSYRQHEHLNLGIAVQARSDELLTAMVPRADTLGFRDFIGQFQERVEAAAGGTDQADESTQLFLSCLGETPVTGGTPLLVAPAVAVLAYSEMAGEADGRWAHLSLTFDHRLIQGMHATRFIEDLSRALEEMRKAAPVPATVKPAAVRAAAAPPKVARDFAGGIRWVLETSARLLQRDAGQLDPEESLGLQGIDSLKSVALIQAFNGAHGAGLPVTLIWRHPTAASLGRYLEEQFPDRFSGTAGASVAEAVAPSHETPRVETGTDREAEPIAIVGLGFRFPGGISDLDAFWALLDRSESAIGAVPAGRFAGEPGREDGWRAGFLDGVDRFDAEFFSISPREAERMDPQQRLFLETLWHALEDAGETPERLSGSNTGVFAGVSNQDYAGLHKVHGVHDAHGAIGVAPSLLANRVSYLLNLRGPSQTLDTACSSSLVALHLAVQSIRAGECDQAFVGGSNLFLSLDLFKSFRDAGMLASDGRNKTFDAGADGYVRGEGVAALLLKPLSAARRDGNPIYALVRGTAVNHGGRAASLTAPNPEAQTELVRTALRSAGIPAATVGYVEAHGTGTPLGDPIEVEALQAAFAAEGGGAGTSFRCGLGSVKPNLGHLEAVAGLAGVIKVLACLKQRRLPPSAELETVNPHLRLADGPFYLLRATGDWTPVRTASGEPLPRRAGVSSFGFGGTNAHVILEEFAAEPRPIAPASRPQLLVLSARTAGQLRAVAAQWVEAMGRAPGLELSDVAHTLQSGRTPRRFRLAWVASTVGEAVQRLGEFLAGRTTDQVVSGEAMARGAKAVSAVVLEPDSSPEALLAAGRAWVGGTQLDWSAGHAGASPRRVSLPGYPFTGESYWLDRHEVPAAQEERSPETAPDGGALLKLVPRWEVFTAGGGYDSVAAGERVLLLGGTEAQVAALRARHPLLHRIENRPATTLEELDGAFRAAGSVDHVYWIAPDPAAASDPVSADPEAGCVNAFRTVKAALQCGYGSRPLRWTVLTSGAEPAHVAERNDPANAAVHGLMGTLAQEYPEWRLLLVDLEPGGAIPAEALATLPRSREGHPLLRRSGQWYRRRLVPVTETPAAASPYRPGGVYVVVGGAGGVGRALSEHLLRRHSARIAWIGRRGQDAEITRTLAALGGLAGAVAYFPADVTDEAALRRAVDQVRQRWGRIHGVIHSAVGSMDQSLAAMDEAQFCAGLRAKTAGSVVLARVFAGEALDFMAFFSSIAAVTSDHGKCSYAAGCAFQDAFAHSLRGAVPFPVKSAGWGYWGGVGIGGAIPQSVKNRLQQSGMRPLPAEEAMRALELLLSGPLDRLMVLRATGANDLQGTLAQDSAVRVVPPSGPGAASVAGPSAVPVPPIAAHQAGAAELDDLLTGVLVDQLLAGGFLPTERARTNDLRRRLTGPAFYQRWWEQILAELAARGWVEPGAEEVILRRTMAPGSGWAAWEAAKPALLKDAGPAAWGRLAETTLRALPEILRGKRPATEVMFAGASTSGVEDIYSGNPVADHFNRVVGEVVVRAIREAVGRNPTARIRVLEIGAGTGATSRAIFPLLAGWKEHVAEYCFTDVSRAFLLQAESRFRTEVPCLRCELFNVEESPSGQGIETGSYDLVIASNVLHATRDIRRTLRNTKAVLRGNGLLILNEIGSRALPPLLTFGLLEGWWLTEDPAVRIPGCPGLLPEAWKAVLAAEGYRAIGLPAASAHALGQQIVVAESDGVICLAAPSGPAVASAPMMEPVTVESPLPAGAGDDALREAATGYFRKAFAEVLKLPAHRIDPAEPLETYGIDSILVMQLTARLRKDFGDLKSTLFFEARTLAGLVSHFLTHQGPAVAKVLGLAAAAAVPEAVSPVLACAAASGPGAGALPAAKPETAEAPDDGIAIIGMSGAFPLAADLGAFWENLRAGRDCITEIPAERWGLGGFYEPDRQKAVREGRSYTKSGGFLDGFADFDPLFFNISPVEAQAMDPQERLFLEHSWRALEDAGCTRELLERRFRGKVGVFTGITSHAFAHHSPAFWNRPQPLYALQPLSSAPNRVSYFFNLRGPSMPVDTMCSSSLTALHLACEQLQRGECDLALAGGVHLNLHPSGYVAMCAKGMLSPGGQCRSFGRGADGFVPGEGVGVLVLKPLRRALAEGDPIHAVIRGTHVNHGGRTNGYTVPNPQAQQELVAEALRRAGTPAATIGCLEAHGTGTELGDPIEVAALTRAFGRAADGHPHCALGSVKSNIGHAEAAAGIAGVMKVILQLRHRTLVPTLHAAELNPEIDFDGSPFFLPRATTPWALPPGREGGPRRAGVSSFGAGGANAHVVLEEAPAEAAGVAEESGPFLVLLSARTPEALVQSARNLLDYASRIADAPTTGQAHLTEVAYTLQVGREPMEERLGLLVGSWAELQDKLAQFIEGGRTIGGVESGSVSAEKDVLQWLVGDDDLQAGVSALLAKRKWPKLLALWVKGVRLDWEKLYAPGAPRPRRVSLPTYPFARRRYWLPDEAATSRPSAVELPPKRTVDPVSAVNELAYLPRWQVQAQPPAEVPSFSGQTVLVVSSGADSAFLEQGRKQVSHLGASRVVQLRWSDRTAQIAPDHWHCNPEDEAAFGSAIPEPGVFDCVVFLGSGASPGGTVTGERLDVPALEAGNERALFRLLKWFQARMDDRRVDFFAVTTDIFPVLEPEPSAIAGAGLIGLACSLAQGDRRFRVRLADLSSRGLRNSETHTALWRQLLSLPPSDRGSVVKLEDGAVYQRTFLPFQVSGPASDGAAIPPAFREGGVYLIVGGAGTVGEIITRRLIERHRARVVWVGRSAPTAPPVARKLESLGRQGGAPLYFQADVTDRESIRQVVREVKARFGVLHGAVFSAVVSNGNNSIGATSEAEFRSILETKTRGSVVFQECLGSECADFLCHFSSIQAFSFTSSRESAGYAAGITFAEAARRAVRCAVPVGSIQWGYWRAFVEGTAFADRLKGRFGLIDDDEGFAFFEWFVGQLRAGVLNELICVRASEEVQALMQASGPTEVATLSDSGRSPVLDELVVERASPDALVSLRHESQAGPFEKLLQRRLMAQLKRVPGFNPDSPAMRPVGLAARHARWWDECVAALAADGATALAPLESGEEWALACARLANDPSLAARIPLVDECLRQLPGILTGRISPAEILFPRGSMERVEGVYQGNPVADFFNDHVAELVRSCVERRHALEPGRTVRILEIGAGTGGTTARVLRQVRADGPNVGYHYTDLSKAFLLFAEEKYAPGNPGLSTRLFNAELSPAEQGITPGSYDLVLATNVLHATRDLRKTVRNAKALLSRHGVLILNEVTRKTWFQFLTFGLLEGWWLFEDPALRIAGSPVLDTAAWLRVLREEGFRVKHGPAGSDESLGQHLFAGESDGLIRQPQRPAGAASPAPPTVPAAALSAKAEATRAGPPADGIAAVQPVIAGALCDTLRLLPSDIRPDVAFADYGIDSILTETLLGRLNAALGITLNASVLYDHSSVARLARHLVAEFGSRLRLTQPLAAVSPGVVPAPTDSHPAAADRTEPAPAAEKPAAPRTLDIAIIGMSGQFPGAADVEAFWKNLVEGVDVIRELPADYLPPELVSSGEKRKGRAYSNRGGVLEDRDCFDPLFFKISPREAESMNPHQRLVLQEGWRALEDAGIDPKSLAERPVGVFVGAEAAGYWHETLSGYSDAIVASRLSYSLNLTGPAFAVNTGCSSSGVALHLACRSLREGESSLALAGGVFAVMNPQLLVSMAQIEMLSRSGTCSTFDQSADGTVLSEGVGMLVLKRLEDAVKDGDPIHGVILGTGINQDGASNGITAPNGAAQEKLIGDVYERHGIDPAGISYVEAHGTGTKLGDPVEGNALVRAFRRFTPARRFCTLGSAKANIGHTAAGAAAIGLIKILLSMRERTLPGLLHFQELNPMIELADSAFVVGDRTRSWEAPDSGLRIAALNAFGHSGTNVHLVVREHPAGVTEAVPSIRWRGRSPGAENPLLIPLSARTDEALAAAIGKLAAFLRAAAVDPNAAPLQIGEIAWTLQSGREAMERRCVFIAGDVATLLGQLDSVRLTPAAVTGGSGAEAELLGIARRWVGGANLDWRAFYGDRVPARRHLPTYVFARERYWKSPAVPSLAKEAEAGAGDVKAGPLAETVPVLRTIPIPLQGTEAYLADHVIDGRKVVAAAALLEFVRAAVAELDHGKKGAFQPLTLEQVVWLRPLVVADGPPQVWVELSPSGGSAFTFAVCSAPAMAGSVGRTVHSTGNVRLSVGVSGSQSADRLGAVRRNPATRLSGAESYRRFAAAGIAYGPSYRVVEKIEATADAAVVTFLQAPGAAGTGMPALDPGLLDGGLQGCLGLADPAFHGGLPFAVESVEIRAPLNSARIAVVGKVSDTASGSSPAKLEVEWLDDRGELLLALRGYSVRRRDAQAAPPAEAELLVLTPEWRPLEPVMPPAPSVRPVHRLVVLVELEDVNPGAVEAGIAGCRCVRLNADTLPLAERASRHTFRLLTELRDLLAVAEAGEIRVQVLVPGSSDGRLFAGLHGLLLSAQQENPRLVGQLIELDGHTGLKSAVDALERGFVLREQSRIRWTEAGLHAWSWRERMAGVAAAAAKSLRPGGVYLITGGLGGLGRLLARHLAETVVNPTILLVGRSSPEQVRADLPTHPGARISYASLDVSDSAAVARFITAVIREHGGLNGIFHSAGVVRDQFLLGKTGAEVREVFAAKVAGALHLDEATRGLELDFLVLFSSMAGVLGNAGQTDYAAANAMLDQFARVRNERVRRGERRGRTVAINWPLWRDGGMQVDEKAEERFRARFGLVPLESACGLRFLSEAIVAGFDQAWVMQGEVSRLRHAFLSPDKPASVDRISEVPPPAAGEKWEQPTADHLKTLLSSVLKMPPHRIEADASWDNYGIDSVMAMDLTSRLEEEFGTLPKTLFFEYQTLRSLAGYFVRTQAAKLAGLLPNLAPPPAPEAAPLSRTVAPEAGPAKAAVVIAPSRSESAEAGSGPEAIAIIGVAGRYPQARDLAEFWENLKQGRDCITEIPAERWDHGLYFDPDPNASGKTYSKWGGFIDGIAEFDPLFFSISPREAAILDPQERLFLQCAYHTAEDAGYTRETFGAPQGGGSGRRVGVFVGVMYEEYQLYGAQETERGRPMALTGSPASIANRVSYFFDLHGPSLAVDTMCSSSLSALHLACQSLLRGECGLAFAGGVNLSVHPNKYLMLAQGRFASSKGRCESFGEGAEGYVPGEGVGAVLLKPLSRALADGDRIQAVIRGTSINHGGRTHGYTVPNPNAQAQVIGRALEEARVAARTIGYLEAHGTGTSLGDPIEIAGLVKAFGQGTPDRQFCALGSVKSNIGHGESAAGIAALTKVLLQLRHRQLVPSLHSRVLNPKIDFSQTPFVVQQELAAWPRPAGHPRRAGISSFGAGGGNAHVILEEAPEPVTTAPVNTDQPVLMVLSARTAERLRVLAAAMAGTLADADVQLAGVAWTLQVGREALEERMAFVATSAEQARGVFSRFAAGETEIAGVFSGNARRQRETIAALSRDEDMDRTLAAWMRKGRVERVLELWSQGLEMDWRALTPAPWPRPVALPHYPFAQERCWFTEAPAGVTKPISMEAPDQSRVPVFLRREWEPVEPSNGTEVRAYTVILASRETQELAQRVATLISAGRVLLVESLDEEGLAGDAASSEFEACIDLVGVGRATPNDAGWMRWLQRVIGGRTSGELRLLGVTCGLESFQNRKVNAAGATRAALYRMLPAEYAGLRSTHLDLDPGDTMPGQAAAVVDQFQRLDGGPEACRRSGTAYRPVFREFAVGSGTETAPAFPADRVLWVTGGTRGLGALCARHLVERHGARKVVLTGVEPLPARSAWAALRTVSGPEGERIRAVETLEQLGAQVEVLPLDLTDSAGVCAAVTDAVRRLGRIGGILHCAGTSDRSNPAWVRKPVESVQRVLAPKTSGLEALAEAVRGEPLDFFVLFSSVSAAVPALAVGLSDYSMANAYMDCFAEAWAGELPLLSLQWPRWHETGAAAGAADAGSYRARGFLGHSNAEGLALLDRLLAARCRGVVLPAWVDRSRWRPQDLLRPLTNPKTAPKRAAVPAALPPATARVPAMASRPVSAGDLPGAVGTWLKDLFSRELRLDASRIDADTPFAEYGSDSVLLAQVLRSVNQRLGIELDPSILLEHPTVHAFTGWLIQRHRGLLAGFATGAENPPAIRIEPAPPAPTEISESVRIPEPVSTRPARGGDLAVVGLSCRLPGAENLEAYWELLRAGRKAIGFAPAERWGADSQFPAGLLAGAGAFDPEFFLIREDDARAMDPQAFLLLEETLRTVCHAGYSVDGLKGAPIGVYVGGRARSAADAEALAEARNPIRAAGNNYLAANISQFFDWHGPSLVVDTACSSALVALQMAAQALVSGEIKAALVGGVSVLESDRAHRLFQSRGILAATPDFHLFDARAGGIVPAEGVGAVLVKTVAQALADGDRIHAVVSGIAVNNDGRTAGPATPNLEAQKAVMRTALARSGRGPEDVGYLEVNGSGSVVTDLLELKAIQAVYREAARCPLWLGSMKPNIGHPLCAEGIAGFIKAVLTLERAQAAPFLSGEQATGHFDLAAASFVLPREVTVWRDLHRVAALNCFADGGTNVHVILESWEPAADAGPTRPPKPMPVLHRRPLSGSRDQARAGEHRIGNGHENGNGHGNGTPVTMPSPLNPKPTNRWRQLR